MKKIKKLSNIEIIELLNENKELSSNKALEAIYRQSFPAIKQFIKKNGGDESISYDIFQDVVIVFLNHLENRKFKEEARISTYLFSIARNMWFQYLKKNKKYQFQGELSEDLSVEVSNQDIDQITSKNVVKELLGKVDKGCSKILIMFYYSHKSMKEIMSEFNLSSVQVAKTKKLRCMKKLAQLLKSNNISKDLIDY